MKKYYLYKWKGTECVENLLHFISKTIPICYLRVMSTVGSFRCYSTFFVYFLPIFQSFPQPFHDIAWKYNEQLHAISGSNLTVIKFRTFSRYCMISFMPWSSISTECRFYCRLFVPHYSIISTETPAQPTSPHFF
jgi:hypothetical protein